MLYFHPILHLWLIFICLGHTHVIKWILEKQTLVNASRCQFYKLKNLLILLHTLFKDVAYVPESLMVRELCSPHNNLWKITWQDCQTHLVKSVHQHVRSPFHQLVYHSRQQRVIQRIISGWDPLVKVLHQLWGFIATVKLHILDPNFHHFLDVVETFTDFGHLI